MIDFNNHRNCAITKCSICEKEVYEASVVHHMKTRHASVPTSNPEKDEHKETGDDEIPTDARDTKTGADEETQIAAVVPVEDAEIEATGDTKN